MVLDLSYSRGLQLCTTGEATSETLRMVIARELLGRR
jgi:hypothetical protein